MKKFVLLAAIGLAALFVASPSPAAAQYFARYNGWVSPAYRVGWGRYRLYDWSVYPRFYRRDLRTVYYYPVVTTPSYSYTAFYPSDQAVDTNTVTLRMHVPTEARVWIEDVATTTGGADRSFVSPPLTPGRDYVYHIRAQWEENGRTMERKREFTVHAGDRIDLNIDK
jgi:uncharacterized protein (TIGR03000 family)